MYNVIVVRAADTNIQMPSPGSGKIRKLPKWAAKIVIFRFACMYLYNHSVRSWGGGGGHGLKSREVPLYSDVSHKESNS